MVKPWDESMKALVRANPQAFVHWLIPDAKFIKEHREKLKGWDQEVDILLEVQIKRVGLAWVQTGITCLQTQKPG